jgi:hypothetical protein
MREFTADLGLPHLPVDNWDGTIVDGEFVADTWGAGLDRLPYSHSVRDSFRKFRDEMLKIDLEKRLAELDNVPLSKFTANHAPELQEWCKMPRAQIARTIASLGRAVWARSTRDWRRSCSRTKTACCWTRQRLR